MFKDNKTILLQHLHQLKIFFPTSNFLNFQPEIALNASQAGNLHVIAE